MRSDAPDPRYQSRWRRAGAIAIGIAGLMALASVWTSILRDTAIHAIHMFSGEPPEEVVPQTPLLVCAGYWTIFLAALITALWLAALDIRYIRLQYALEERKLYKDSLGDDLTSALADKHRRR